MPLSAALLYHMVSEPRLLMSALQDDPMGGDSSPIDRSCPPFGVSFFGSALYQIETGFDPNLPPFFDVYHDENMTNQILQLRCLNESEALVGRGIKSEPMNLFRLRYSAVRLAIERNDAVLPIVGAIYRSTQPITPIGGYTSPRSGSGIQKMGQNVNKIENFPTAPYDNFRYSRTRIGLGMQMLKWDEQQASRVFNPGIWTAKGERLWQPLSRQCKTQELGQFFLKKGRMIRVQLRSNEGENYIKVRNQFNAFPMII